MNKDRQLTVIATAIGYEWQLNPDGQWYLYGPPGTETVNRQLYHLDVHNKSIRVTLASLHASLPNIEALKLAKMAEVVPNFPEDLNAMHGAVQQFRFPKSQSLWKVFQNHLEDIVSREKNISKDSVSFQWEVQNATAQQRADAFVLTIRKWEDSQ